MNKNLGIIKIAIWAVVALLLCGILFTTIFKEDNMGNFWNDLTSGISSWTVNDSDYVVVGDYTVPGNDIKKVDLTWRSGKVELVPAQDDQIRIVESASKDFPKDKQLQYEVKDGVLTIKQGDNIFRIFSFGFGNRSSNVIVYLPQKVYDTLNASCTSGQVAITDLNAKTIDASSTSGKVNLSGIQAESLSISNTSGSILGSGITAKQVNCNTTSGRAEIVGEMGQVQADCVSGNLILNFSNLPERIKADAISGKISVTLPENNGFEVNYSITSGNFNSEFALQSSSFGSSKHGTGTYKEGGPIYTFGVVSGQIELLKAD